MFDQAILKSSGNIANGFDGFVDIALIENGQFQSVGPDPQCQLLLTNNLSPGWYVIQYQLILEEGKIRNPKFYLDSGDGYNESEIILLPRYDKKPVRKIVYIPKSIRKIRFDPTEEEKTIFKVLDFALTKLSPVKLYREIRRSRKNNRINNRSKSVKLVLKNDVKQIEALFQNSFIENDPFLYGEWIDNYDTYTEDDFQGFKARQSAFASRPLISVLLPTYNSPHKWLRECIESVIEQVYDNWELCIADDNSTDEEVRTIIKEYANADKRIKFEFRQENGHIAATSNSALSLATGEFITLLDHDDKFPKLSLYRVVEAINEDRSIDFFYSDEDKIDTEGNRSLPFFKPEWSPALLFSQNYITHLACIRRELLLKVNGFTKGMDGSQDYDVFLKVILAGAKVKHLPYILYHWRLHESSTSMVSASKPYAHIAGKQALESFLSKKYPEHFSRVDDGENTFTYLPRFRFNKENKISIIIPTKDKIEFLEPCIKSIREKSTWLNYEIIILDNNSTEQNTFAFFDKIQKEEPNIRVIEARFEFNWSKLNNFGSRHATGNYLIFLNNDISVITPEWMEMLCEYASLPDVASVGASLLYEDNTLQHSGVVVGMNGWADHVFKGMHPSHFPSPYVSNVITRNVLAVTGACVAVEKSKFDRLGGFDEDFIICGSDVEFGIRAFKKGLFSVILGTVRLFHYESKSRGSFVPENDFVQSSIKYEPYRTQQTDPFFNPNLSLMHTSPTCKS